MAGRSELLGAASALRNPRRLKTAVTQTIGMRDQHIRRSVGPTQVRTETVGHVPDTTAHGRSIEHVGDGAMEVRDLKFHPPTPERLHAK
jgi:hypothetical protein